MRIANLGTKILATTVVLLMLYIGTNPSRGQEVEENLSAGDQASLTVGLNVSPPFVMKEGQRFTGMAVELWEELAAREKRPFEYREFATFGELIQATHRGEVDVAVTNLTVNEDRARQIDFTQPWLDGGLRIMVNENTGAGFGDVLAGLNDSGFLRSYAWIAFVILLASVLFTLFDRRFDREFTRSWRDGFAESFHTVMQIATTGRPAQRKNLFGWVGRVWQGLWLMVGVAVLAYVTSSVTSVMTTLSLTNQIQSIRDLSNRTVGVLKDSVASEYARDEGLRRRSFLTLDDAVAALRDGEIAAIVEDAPVLEYYAHSHPAARVRVVGRLFAPDKYAFAIPPGSALRRPMTIRILSSQESGEIARLKNKYFGNDS